MSREIKFRAWDKRNKRMIKLKNIDLSKITLCSQIKKSQEEDTELWESIQDYEREKTEDNRNHVIEEFWDMVQAGLGVLQKLGISAYEVQEGYTKHHKKMDKRGYKPRVKESVENCNGRFEKKESLKDES